MKFFLNYDALKDNRLVIVTDEKYKDIQGNFEEGWLDFWISEEFESLDEAKKHWEKYFEDYKASYHLPDKVWKVRIKYNGTEYKKIITDTDYCKIIKMAKKCGATIEIYDAEDVTNKWQNKDERKGA